MNIGFVVRKFSFGGGEKIQQFLMHEFYERENNIFIFTWDSIEIPEAVEKFNIVYLKNKSNKFFQFIYEMTTIPGLLYKYKIDFIIVFGLEESFILSSYSTKTSSITSLRIDPRFSRSQLLMKQRYPLSLHLSSGVVFQTNIVKEHYSVSIQRKSIVIPNPVIENGHFKPFKNRLKRIVAVGRLSVEKNFSMLVDAFAMLDPNEYELCIFGDGYLENDLKDKINAYGLQDKILMMGESRNLIEDISVAEIFVLTSDFEGMPNALIEAMSLGLACISTNFPSGAAEELIHNGYNGMLIPVGSLKQLVHVLKVLIEDSDNRLKISHNAMKIKNLLNKDLIINQWLTFFDSIKHLH